MLQGGSSVTMKRYYRHGIVASIEIWKLVRDWYKRLFLKRMFSKKWMAGFTPNFATRWATITPTKSLVQTFTPRSRCILPSCDQMHNNLSDPKTWNSRGIIHYKKSHPNRKQNTRKRGTRERRSWSKSLARHINGYNFNRTSLFKSKTVLKIIAVRISWQSYF